MKGTAGQTVTVTDTFDVKELPTSKDVIGGFQLFGSDGSSIAVVRQANTGANSTDQILEVKLVALGGTTLTGSSVPVTLLAGSSVIVSSGTLTANQGTPNTVGNRWPVQLTDGTNLLPISTAGIIFAQTVPVIFSPTDIGTLNVSQQGTVAGSLGTATLNSFAGNATLTPGAALLYSAMFTGTGAANKVLTLGGNQVSSKTAASSPADLLDRIIAVPSATALGLANGVAGDTIRVTYVLLP